MDTAIAPSLVSTDTAAALGQRSTNRCRSTELHPDVSLGDAATEFDRLLVAAHHHRVVERPDIRGALGAVVHAIASAIQHRPTIAAPADARTTAADDEPIGSVLLDRAAARFSTRVIGTEIGRRPCPSSVLAALDHARRTLVATDSPDRGRITTWT